MDKPSVLIIGADTDIEARLIRTLKDFAKVVGSEPANLERALETYRRLNPGVILVVVSFDPEGSSRLTTELTQAGARVVVVSPAKDPDLILQSMRAGAREFVVEGEVEDLQRAIRAQAKSTTNGASGGSVITVFPAKGGVGATAIATNLAGALQRRGQRVCLLDLDLHLGDVLSFLDLPGNYSITDVISNMRRLDRDLLDTSITRHHSGVRVLAQSGKIEEADHIRAPDITALIQFLRPHYDRVVIDGVRGFDEIALAALDASDRVVMVLTQDVPAVRNTQRCLELFNRLGYGTDKLMLVLNRYQKGSKITNQVVSETLGVHLAHEVANDFVALIGAINRGLLLNEVAPRSRLTKDIDDLAPLVDGTRPPDARRGLLGGLMGGKKPPIVEGER